MSEQGHPDTEGDSSYGIALGFRIFEHDGELYLAEAEISPYVDEPESLGVTLVFHPLGEMDPTVEEPEMDWPSYPVDMDDDLQRDEDVGVREQFAAIARQLSQLTEEQLRDYLRVAREEAES
ncbi:MAG: hypothetical protein M3409_10755 [Gemmatimonadota bacterium]|jgi:hypothetical protein|nr:hypothetical protein [Gemmatimonadota bacterium]